MPPPKSELPSGYGTALAELKTLIQQTRLRTVLSANVAMIQLYWEMGQRIRVRMANEGWGAKVVDRLSMDMREAFPDMSGLSSRNLRYMRDFAAAWSEAKLPWGQNLTLLDKLSDVQTRLWCAEECAKEGWSRSILEMQIERRPVTMSRLQSRHSDTLSSRPIGLKMTAARADHGKRPLGGCTAP